MKSENLYKFNTIVAELNLYYRNGLLKRRLEIQVMLGQQFTVTYELTETWDQTEHT
ncbi:hypothetical protein Hanom_Chr07g00629951 [Helianthus anomalus]